MWIPNIVIEFRKFAVEDNLLLTHHCFANDYGQLLIPIFTRVLQLSNKITKLPRAYSVGISESSEF